MIRKACEGDVSRIIDLLHQVNMVHHAIRPDLFKPDTTKYDEQQIKTILDCQYSPIFVYDDGGVAGYAFCQVVEMDGDRLRQDIKTLHIDDLCVDENARGQHIGKALFDYVREYARSIGCRNITLDVWAGNDAAVAFYRNMGMGEQHTCMELILK